MSTGTIEEVVSARTSNIIFRFRFLMNQEKNKLTPEKNTFDLYIFNFDIFQHEFWFFFRTLSRKLSTNLSKIHSPQPDELFERLFFKLRKKRQQI